MNEILGKDLRDFCIPQDTKVINQLFETCISTLFEMKIFK